MTDQRRTDINIEIDSNSGFCFGVTAAIQKAEAHLADNDTLYCLGDIVHNSDEVQRLREKGLITITHSQLEELHDVTVLLRAHGEPPSTYATARRNNIRIIDATCPVVLKLQQRIHDAYHRPAPPQIVIYGKAGHAEVNGLVGQTDGNAIVIDDSSKLDNIDFTRPIALYSQTTKSLDGYRSMAATFTERAADVALNDTICRQVANRTQHITQFAGNHDLILFVCGKKSSNGHILYQQCLQANPRTHLIENPGQIQPEWLAGARNIGICGATSTPRWLMEQVRDTIPNLIPSPDRQ